VGGPVTGSVRRGSRAKPLALSLLPAFLFLLGVLALLVWSPGFRAEVVTVWDLLRLGEPEPLREWLVGYGIWAPVISAILQVVTSVFPPGPSFLLSIANAMLYGAVLGGLLSFVTALGAAAICFGIARAVGRPGIERLVTPESLGKMDRFMERRGVLAVFIGRVVPFINPDLVSYAAGVTSIGWIPFLVAVGAGQVPAIIFYSLVGAAAMEFAGWVILAVFAAAIVPLFLLALFGRRIAARF
jgi:uncharacterized membrane protein YdjX (TVP38/TMEM64 family)